MFKKIGSNIKALRKAKKMTQEDLGKKISVKRQQIANYESGETSIPLQSAVHISSIFDISIDDLIFRDFTIKPNSQSTVILKQKNDPQKISEEDEYKMKGVLENHINKLIDIKLEPLNEAMQKVLFKLDMEGLKSELEDELKMVNNIINTTKNQS